MSFNRKKKKKFLLFSDKFQMKLLVNLKKSNKDYSKKDGDQVDSNN